MNDERHTLAAALRRAAAELARESPPPALLARVHAALPLAAPAAAAADAGAGPQATPQRRAAAARTWTWPRGAAWGMACATVLAGSLVLMLRQPAPPATAETLLSNAFVPLLPPERWPAERGDATAAWLVSTELSGDRLAALGLPFDPSRAGEPVRAELLVHASGDVLAVRLLR